MTPDPAPPPPAPAAHPPEAVEAATPFSVPPAVAPRSKAGHGLPPGLAIGAVLLTLAGAGAAWVISRPSAPQPEPAPAGAAAPAAPSARHAPSEPSPTPPTPPPGAA
ncbi:MAG: hypothetical protein KY449_09720, partial [Proteobacteria bacterium]|nr:hypothetical protein [Pseudomonadota bacterium]